MCNHGTVVELNVRKKAGGRVYTAKIDSCIADQISILQRYGRITRQSCCGHGKWPGWVQWEDKSYSYINSLDVIIQFGSREGYLIERRSKWWAEYEQYKQYPEFMNMKLGLMILPVIAIIKRDFSFLRRLMK